MFNSFVEFIEQNLGEKRARADADPQQALRLAMAALCVEMARADMQEKPQELERAKKMLAQRFSLADEEAQALIVAGQAESGQAVSLSRFTRLLNDHLDEPEKLALLEMLWRVAYEDGTLDKYEDALMHKLAELMYVPITALMLAKEKAQTAK